MTKEIYKKAQTYVEDIDAITSQIAEVEEKRHWITTSTPHHNDGARSLRFQNDLVNWLKQIRAQYQKEFDELK